jgi:hypothetical protein
MAAPEAQPEPPAWREQAAFHVTLDRLPDADGEMSWRTHAYHEETGDERVQPGVLDHDLVGWMRARAGLPAALASGPEAPPAPETERSPETVGDELRLAAGELEVLELPAERQAGGEEIGTRLSARVSFELTGAAAYLATADMAGYSVQVLAFERGGAAAAVLAERRAALRPEHLSYAETLDLDLPPVGSYQLIASVVLPDSAAAAVAVGPVLNVVP